MNPQVYQDDLQHKLRTSVGQLKLNSWTMQQDGGPKRRRGATTEDEPHGVAPSPDLSPLQMLWLDLKIAIHTRSPTNIRELKRPHPQKCCEIPPGWCRSDLQLREMLVRLVQPTKGQPKGPHTFTTLHLSFYMSCSTKTDFFCIFSLVSEEVQKPFCDPVYAEMQPRRVCVLLSHYCILTFMIHFSTF